MAILPLPDDEDIDAIRADIRAQLADLPEQYHDAARDRYVKYGGDLKEMVRAAVQRAQIDISKAVNRGTVNDQWRATRANVYERDGARCHVCGTDVVWDNYECGHIVDRVAGGTDRPSNLVCMCIRCNRLKPVHDTRDAYIAWVDGGGWLAELLAKLPR